MRELLESSTDISKDPAAHHAAELLHHYSFELDRYSVDEQLCNWLEYYSANWVTMAIIEALYQGRYKAISVEQILILWQRRGHPLCHFNHEFERLVCNRFPRTLVRSSVETPEVVVSEFAQKQHPVSFQQPTLSYRKMLLQLPSVKAASTLERLTEIPSLKLTPLSSLNGMEPPQQLARSPRETSSSYTKEGSSDNGFGKPIETNGELAHPVAARIVPLPTTETPNELTSVSAAPNPPELVNESNGEFKRFKEGVVFALSSGLATRSLKPKLRLELSKFLQSNWQQFITNPSPINQFVPDLEPSGFHSKLRSVAQSSEEEGARVQEVESEEVKR